MPKVSVVICTYNQVHLIGETIESVLAQTYPDIEVIVADDASIDGTQTVLSNYHARFPDKVKLILGERNLGIPANINRGLALVTGQYVAWLDGDDLMKPEKIQLQVDLLQKNPKAIGCYHDATVFDSQNGNIYGSFALLYNGKKELRQGEIHETLRPRYFALPSTVMCRSEVLPANGFDERLPQFSEFLFFTEVFAQGTVLAIEQELTMYRRHEANLTANDSFRQKSFESELIAYSIITAKFSHLATLMNRFRTSSLLTQALYLIRKRNYKQANRYLTTAFMSGAPLRSMIVWCLFFGYFTLNSISKDSVEKMGATPPYQRSHLMQRLLGFLLG